MGYKWFHMGVLTCMFKCLLQAYLKWRCEIVWRPFLYLSYVYALGPIRIHILNSKFFKKIYIASNKFTQISFSLYLLSTSYFLVILLTLHYTPTSYVLIILLTKHYMSFGNSLHSINYILLV